MTNHFSPQLQQFFKEQGIINPNNLTTKQASEYSGKMLGIPVKPSTLEVYRSTSRGPKYRKIQSRVFYSIEWLDEWARGVEVKIYDPTQNHHGRVS
jgi:hypothetical protein